MKPLSSKDQVLIDTIVKKIVLILESKQIDSCKGKNLDTHPKTARIDQNGILNAVKKNILVIIGSCLLVSAWYIQTVLLENTKDRIALANKSEQELNETLGRIVFSEQQERNDLLLYNFSVSSLFEGYTDDKIRDYAYSTIGRMYRTAVEWFAAEKYWLKYTFSKDSVMIANQRFDKKLDSLQTIIDSLVTVDENITRNDTVLHHSQNVKKFFFETNSYLNQLISTEKTLFVKRQKSELSRGGAMLAVLDKQSTYYENLFLWFIILGTVAINSDRIIKVLRKPT